MIVEYQTTRAQRARTEAALREIVDPDAVLVGPVVFDQGTYALVSSVAEGASTAFSGGEAPVLENGRVAISLQFGPEGASILDAALQAATPDLSIAFDLTYSGVRSSYDAEIVVDWDKASSSLDEGLSAGVSVYGVSIGGEIERAVTRLMTDGAIRVEVRGEDADMDALVAHVQETATELLFTPVEDPDAATDFADFSGIGGVDENVGKSVNRYFSLNAKAKYRRKEIATTGVSRISLSKQGPATRRWSIVFDAGEIAADLRDDPRFVRTVDLADSAIVERRLRVVADHALREAFEHLLDLATVEVRKTHADGRETFRQATLSPEMVEAGEALTISYPRFAGETAEIWLEYETRVVWAFRGEPESPGPWKTARADEIRVYAPYRMATIYPIGDLEALVQRGVRAVIVEVSYSFLGRERHERRSALTTSAEFPPFDLVAPRDEVDFEYQVTHVYAGDRRETMRSSDRSGFVTIDGTASPSGEETNTRASES
jgi:hypothetical protein